MKFFILRPTRPSRRRLGLRAAHACLAMTALSAGLLGTLRGQTSPTQLAPVVTLGTRTLAAATTIGSLVETITAAELALRQQTALKDALGNSSGTPVFASGTYGALGSVFMRGANSNQTLFLVDGIRLNDPNTDYQVFLGGACLSACDSLEIAHGPQSTLYGGEAIGGVVSLRAQRGFGAPSARVSAETGSFGTIQGAVSAQGTSGANSFVFATAGGHTDNNRANNAFDSATTTLRLDRTLNDHASVGATVRWFHGFYGDPGDRYTNDPDNTTREENLLVTTFADLKWSDVWTSHTVLGGQDRRFVAESPRAGRPTAITVVKNRRAVLDSQTTYTGVERNRLTAGFTAEANHTRNTGFGDINKKQALLALFAQDEFTPLDTLFFTAGLRSDDFDTFGHATTGRATAAWLVAPRSLKLRTSYGTAFRSPSFLDLYGQSAFYVGNPNVHPERARGWDSGVDYYLPNKNGTLSATWFETDFTDLIASTANFRSVENIQRARTRGAELTARTTLPSAIEIRASFTYLEAQNLTSNTRLLRRPRQSGHIDAWHDFGAGVSAGAGINFAAHRRDVNAKTYAQIDQEDYTVTRLYAAWQITPRLALKLRFENLLNETYEEVNGYPALGFGAFSGLEWKF
ncbi:MAG: TonB-dependent receptor [Opitutaceae bacterium]